jgi:hypothetical protein
MLTTEERVDQLEVLFGQFMTQMTQVMAAILRMERTTEAMKVQAEKDRQQADKDRRELARQLGDISHRLGTVVEDIIAPSLRRLAGEELGCGKELFFAVRLSKTRPDDPDQSREFDAFFVGEKAVMLNESKATARPEYAQAFVEFLGRGDFFRYFPEYVDRPVVPVFSSLYLSIDLVTYLTRQGIYAVAMGDEAMQVLKVNNY